MAESRLDVKLGNMSFTAEGNETWVTDQWKMFLELASKTPVAHHQSATHAHTHTPGSHETGSVTTLKAHLEKCGDESNQVRRFLATADWLRLNGTTTLTSSFVAKAMKDAQQPKLSNPADALNKNVAKGHAEKTSDGFFITPAGLKELGHEE